MDRRAEFAHRLVRITFFTDYFRPEPPPPAHHIAERAAAWVRDGQQVTVVTNHPNYPDGRVYAGHRNSMRAVESVDGYRVVRVWTHVASHSSKLGKLVDQASFTVSAVLQAVREPAPDVVVASSPHLFAGLAGAVYARIVRRPFLLEVRDLWPDSVLRPGSIAYRAFKVIERIIYRSADVVTVLTPAFEEHVRREGARAPCAAGAGRAVRHWISRNTGNSARHPAAGGRRQAASPDRHPVPGRRRRALRRSAALDGGR
ncbi:MAG: hypothetical protein EBU31_08180 [Proteobacteria bacterium]|nr:hypothetical protein [Pseudomonadota bacterium]